MQTHLTLDWADGSYDFRLTWSGCAEIERKCNAGIQAVYERVMLAGASTVDVVEIIRQGLLGGKTGLVDEQPVEVKPATANALIARYVTGEDAPPFADSWNVAKAILHTFMVGHEAAQKKRVAEDDLETNGSTPPRSSPTAP
ncbi:gene transfer agent family protein [Sphingobium fuliginis]|uniref:Gene transfer agent family protein n=1 Tax=Sphingobium fuliginis ATCC 27551 TaxID=1208342 RepID=A0A5B8CC97_SPHSA|nr:gene transfer agent family protein [Sphingobium fuliginis]QDC37104.1 gene transfer agent family protein [Sphingobium fuliginis ATCC 27551]